MTRRDARDAFIATLIIGTVIILALMMVLKSGAQEPDSPASFGEVLYTIGRATDFEMIAVIPPGSGWVIRLPGIVTRIVYGGGLR